MKFLRLLPSLFLVFTLFAINSCQRDIDLYVPDNNNIGQILNPSPVQATVNGKVVDENNQDVVGATVRSGAFMTVTDSRGLFRFDNITMDKYASVVTVELNGYFKGIRTFSATEGSSNFVKIKLIPKTLIGTINASAGGTVTLPNNSIVTLMANSVAVKATGLAYTGLINVYAANIDPTLSDIPETVPGSFQAIDASNFRVLLKSYGMIAVQLEGQSGELLQIAPDKTAKLRFTIPASLANDAPSTIPLWSLDETDGLWKEEGQAAKTAGYYEGDVAHFSFWNCDAGNNTVYLEMTVVTSNGPLPATLVRITKTSDNSAAYGYTDSTGHVGGLVFSNEPMLLEIMSSCSDIVYSQNIGPFTQNTNLGTITVPIPGQYILDISGTAVDCNATPVLNGFVMIYAGGFSINAPIINGSFSTTLTRCSNAPATVEIVAIDIATMQQSTTWTGTAPASGTLNTGTLTACGISALQYITYSINAMNYAYYAPPDTLQQYVQGLSSMFSGSDNSQNYVSFTMDYTNVGLDSSQLLQSFYATQLGGSTSYTMPTPIYVHITEFGNVGEYISGSFSGDLVSIAPPSTFAITCDFRIKRTQ